MSPKQPKDDSLLGKIGRSLSRLWQATDDTASTKGGRPVRRPTKARRDRQSLTPPPPPEFFVEPAPRDDEHRQLQTLLRHYVTDHLGMAGLEMQQMADDLKVSRTRLFAMTHDAFGLTPLAYLTERRMEYAYTLLHIGVKANVVAIRCGYKDPKYFGKVFLRRFGLTPTDLRLAKQEEKEK